MFRKIEMKMAPAEKGGGGGGQKGSTAMDEVMSDEDLATRGGEEDLEVETKGADRGDVVPGAEKDEDEEETPAADKAEEEEEPDPKAKKGKADAGGEEEEEEEEGEEEPDPKAKKGKADAGEEEEEEEEEPDPKAAKKADKAEKGKGKNQDLIPRSRYNSLRQRFDRLLERVEKDAPAEGAEEEEEENTTAAKATKTNPLQAIDARLEAIDDELEKAADDNDKAKVKALRKEERQLGAKRTEILVAGASTAASRQAVEQSRYDTVVEAIEEEFPWLNPDNKEAEDPAEKFNPKLAREVREMTAGFEAVGYSPSKALMKAMKYFSGDDRTPKKGAADDDAEDESLRKSVKRKTDVAKNIDTANKTPPSMRKAGADSDKAGTGKEGKINVGRLTDDDFAKLPESTKARLRGDEV